MATKQATGSREMLSTSGDADVIGRTLPRSAQEAVPAVAEEAGLTGPTAERVSGDEARPLPGSWKGTGS
jgi:hypothetical protein